MKDLVYFYVYDLKKMQNYCMEKGLNFPKSYLNFPHPCKDIKENEGWFFSDLETAKILYCNSSSVLGWSPIN